MTDTYYDRLGISSNADQDTIKQAWRQAVKEKHPDNNDDPNAQQQFIQLKEAYDVLSDPDKRERYDQLGHDAYVDDRHHGSSQNTQNEYQRDRTQHEDHQTNQSTTETGRGVNWQANTRGHDAAEHVWKPGSGPTADTAPPTNTADATYGKRATAYGACILIPGILSVFVTGAWTSGLPEYGIQAGISAGSIALTIAAALLVWSTIAGAEWLLDTDRQLWRPF